MATPRTRTAARSTRDAAPTAKGAAAAKPARGRAATKGAVEPAGNGNGAVQHYRPDVGLLTWTLKLAEREAAKELDRTLRHTGLTKSQFGVMQALTHLEKASSAALARTVFVTPQAMVGIVAGLERKGFIRRKASAASARVIEATVTPAGRAAYEHAAAAIHQVDAAIAGEFTSAELAQMSSHLQRLIDVLQRHGADS
jgi:DNA-binding MarR family transcriptional regulator